MKIFINKISEKTYALSIPEKDISINFNCIFSRKDNEMFELVLNTLIFEIKERLFVKVKKKNKKISI